MIAEVAVSVAAGLVVVSTALGRRRFGPAEHEGIAPSWTDPDDDHLAPGVTEWLEQLAAAPPPEPVEPPTEGSDAWWAQELHRVRGVLDEATAAFAERLYAAVGPELVLAEQEIEHQEFWNLVTQVTPAQRDLQCLTTPTGEYPAVAGLRDGLGGVNTAYKTKKPEIYA